LEEDPANDLIKSVMKSSSSFESIFLDDFQCSQTTWTALLEACSSALADADAEQEAPSWPFKLLLRRIQITRKNKNNDHQDQDERKVESFWRVAFPGSSEAAFRRGSFPNFT
jgi:hypothetical protein